MSRKLSELVGSVWKLEDNFYGDMRFVVVQVMENAGADQEYRDVCVLDCQSGATVNGWYDVDRTPNDPTCEVIVCGVKKDGKSLGPQYLLPDE